MRHKHDGELSAKPEVFLFLLCTFRQGLPTMMRNTIGAERSAYSKVVLCGAQDSHARGNVVYFLALRGGPVLLCFFKQD